MNVVAAPLQGGSPMVFLIILATVFLVTVPIMAQVPGRAASRNPNRPGGDGNDDRGGTSPGRRG
jgi:hypothetical protein